MKQFAVIGLGSFGSVLATKLAQDGCEVLAVDENPTRVESVRDVVLTAVIADVTSRKALESLPLADMDRVAVCLGDHMDASILAALYLKELGVKEIWAKAIDEDHAKILTAVGVSHTILPERDTALRLARDFCFPNMLDYFPLHPDYSIAEMAPLRDFVGRSFSELNLGSKLSVQVIAVRDGTSNGITMAPDGSYVVRDTDLLVLLGRNKDINRLKGRDSK